jgi:spermidine synthase
MDIYPGKEDTLLHQTRSALQEIKVFDKQNGLRYLILNGVQHGGHLPGQPAKLVLPYFRLAFAAMAFLEAPKRYLFIGLGMGAMPTFLHAVQPDAEIDVVEIDPGVVDVAREWFGFVEDGRLRVTVGDGREYVKNTSVKYDAVFLDAYADLGVPSHLTTLEFMQEVRAVIAPGGVAVSNLWGSVVNPQFSACVRTLQDAFTHLYQFRSYTYNFIFIADTKEKRIEPGELLTRAKKAGAGMELGFDLVGMVRRQYQINMDKEYTVAPLRDPVQRR